MKSGNNIEELPVKPPSGGPTRDEILAVALQKLDLKKGDIFADIGCGTGKITLTVAHQVSWTHSVDIREAAYEWTSARVHEEKIMNVTVYHENAVTVLANLQKLDSAFIGGSKNLEEIIRELSRLKIRTVIITAVLLETVNKAVKSLQENLMFKEVIHIQVSKSYPIAGGIMLKPLDPVYLIYGGSD